MSRKQRVDNENKKGLIEDKLNFSDKSFKLIANDSTVVTNNKAFHEEIEIKYCYEGSFNILINSDVFTIRAGDITLTNPYEVHENLSIGNEKAKYYVLIFGVDIGAELGINADLRRLFFVEKKKFKNIFKDNPRIREVIKNIVEEKREKKEHYQTVLKGLIEQLIALLLRDGLKEDESNYDNLKPKETIVPALSLIHNEYANKLSVERLAGVCCMSVSSFLRAFKTATGTTPIRYLIEYRMSIADMLLQSTDKACEEIAVICGFDDPTYFNKLYKKTRGISPHKSRKKS